MNPVQRLGEIFEDWQAFAARDGLGTSTRAILTDLGQLPYRRLHFLVLARSLVEPLPEPPAVPGLEIHPFGEDDLARVRQIDRISEAKLSAERLAQGHKGLFAMLDGQPAGYCWGTTDPQTRLERVHPTLADGDVLCTDAYTAPAFRGRGIQTALTIARFELFRGLGCRRAICTIERENKPSLAVWQRKLNSQVIGTIDFMRVGAWYRIRYA
jgi:GNAT superfamily N-acetyltransferase